MPISIRKKPSVDGWPVVERGVGRPLWPALLALVVLTASLQADDAVAGAPLREQTLQIARRVMASIGHRIIAPVRLEVVNDSSDAVLGGFTEALTEAGHTPRLTEAPGMSGTVIQVRRTTDRQGGGVGLDVRVEQWPERSVLYARLWLFGEASDGDDDGGFLDRVLVPVVAGTAAVLIVYLFFTVRS